MQWITDHATLVAAAVALLSEVLALIPEDKIKANSVAQLLVNAAKGLLRFVADFVSKKPGGPALVLVVLSLAACKASPEVVALTSLRFTAQSIADAEKIYHDRADYLIADNRAKAEAACATDAGVDPMCVRDKKAPLISAMRHADAALLVYAHALKSGVDVASKDYRSAANEVIDALAPLGILVKGGK